MLVFVIPLKSRKSSTSWERVCMLFERCIKSVCNQTASDFRAIVVCNDKPEIEFNHPHITYLEVDFPPPNEPNPIANGYTDKGRKVLAGLVCARELEPSHTMSVDADDCLSKHIAEFVNKHPNCNGWYVNKGYKYQDGSRFIYIKRNDFYQISGTCNIIKYDLNELPENPEYNRGCGYYKYYYLHQQIKYFMAEKGTPIEPLPFAGAVYILGHGDNMLNNLNRLSFNIINARPLTKSIREEFGLYNLAQ